jgi:hypothetical protein
VDASPSTDPRAPRKRRHTSWSTPGVRLAAIGAIVVVASLALPWYGVQLELFQTISESGLSAFSPAMAALLLTSGAALYLAVITARGYRLPRPLTAGGVMIAAGIWCAALTGVLTLDPPGQIFGINHVEAELGPIVALGGAAIVALGGVRMRRRGVGTVDGQK